MQGGRPGDQRVRVPDAKTTLEHLEPIRPMRRRSSPGLLLAYGFIALIAYDRPLLATLVAPGLTLGILLGALVIVVSWLLTYGYVRWANTHYDPALRALDTSAPNAGASR